MKKIGQILCVLSMVFLGFVWSISEAHAQLLNNNSSNSGYDTYYSNPGGTVGVGKYSGSDTGYTRTDFSTYDVPSSTTKSSATTSSSSGSGSSADNGKIFRILESKIYDTLMDLREIVYMIAGFGLVMFTVMAIFNKISYKHLGYIMIGLSLLALMFPFIEYFSGYTTEALRNQRELTFRSFLDPNVSMERIQGTGYKEIVYPSYQGEVPSDVSEGGLSDEELASLQNQQNFTLPDAAKISVENTDIELPQTIDAQIPDINRAIYDAGCDPRTMKGEWDEKTMQRLVCSVDDFGNVLTTYEACEGGKIKNGVCKATVLTTISNITQGTQAALSTVANATGAVMSGIGTAVATYEGAKNIVDAIENAQWDGDNFMDTVNNIYGSTQGVLSTIQAENNIIAGGVLSTTQQIANTMDGTSTLASLFNTNYENNPYGDNNLTGWWTAVDDQGNRINGLYNGLDGVADVTQDIQFGVNVGTGTLGTIAHDTYGIIGTVDQFSQDLGIYDPNVDIQAQVAAEQQAAAEAAAAEAAAQRALLEAQNRAAEEEMRRAQEEALRQEQRRQAQLEAERRAAEEEMRRAQNTKAAETAMDNLTMDQLASYVQSGQITFEQALSLAMAQEARKAQAAQQAAQQAQEAMQSAQEEYNQALENANQANKAVAQAEEKVKNSDGTSLMSALVDLDAAQQAASDAQEAADKAKTAYDSAQKTYSNAQKTYESQQTKAEQAETTASEALKDIMSNVTNYDGTSESGDDTGGAGADGSGASS